MANAWYYRSGGATHGPIATEELRKLAREGAITRETPVAVGRDGPFQPSSRVQNLWPAPAAVANAAASLPATKPGDSKSNLSSVSKAKLPVAQRIPESPPASSSRIASPPPLVRSAASPPPAPAHGALAPPAPFAPPGAGSSSGLSFSLNTSGSSATLPALRGAPKPGGSSATNPKLVARKRKPSKALLFAIWGTGGALLVAMGVVFVVVMMNGDRSASEVATSKQEGDERIVAQSSTTESGSAPESDRAEPAAKLDEPSIDASSAGGLSPSAVEAAEPVEEPPLSPSPAKAMSPDEKLFKAIGDKQWHDGSPDEGIRKDYVTIRINEIWSGPDVGYRPDWLGEPGEEEDEVFAATDLKGEQRVPPAPRLQGEKIGPLKYLFVRLAIGNEGDKPFEYTSWNGAPEKPQSAAVLGTPEALLGRIVPLSEAPAADRKTSATVAPGEKVYDVLVFEKPAEPAGAKAPALCVVLPYSAVGLEGQVGFKMPRAALIELPESEVAISEPAVPDAAAPEAAASGAAKLSAFEELRKKVEKKPAEAAAASSPPATSRSATSPPATSPPATSPPSSPPPPVTP